MSDELEQSRWFAKISARIETDGVHIYERGPLGLRSYQTRIPFHQIPDDVVRIANVPRLLLIASIVFGLSFARSVFLVISSPSAAPEALLWPGFRFALSALALWAQSGRTWGTCAVLGHCTSSTSGAAKTPCHS